MSFHPTPGLNPTETPARPTKTAKAAGHIIGALIAAYVVLLVLGALTLLGYLLIRLAMAAAL